MRRAFFPIALLIVGFPTIAGAARSRCPGIMYRYGKQMANTDRVAVIGYFGKQSSGL